MKILLYVILGLVGIVILLIGGTFFYATYFDKPAVAIIELTPSGLFDQEVVQSVIDVASTDREETQYSLAILNGDRTEFYGIQRSNDTIRNVSNSYGVYEIGSISKVFTSYVIHKLIIDPHVNLSLDDSLIDHLPIDNQKLGTITIQSLINHTSGLPISPTNLDIQSPNDPYRTYNKEELYEYLESYDNASEVGTQSIYSNLAYATLGALAEELTGKPIAQLYNEMVFDPLGMDNSSFYLDSVSQVVSPGKWTLNNPGNHWNFDILGAAGAIKSSVDQMTLFMRHLLEQDSVSLMMQKESFVNSESIATAMGLFIHKGDSKQAYWHNGATQGFNSFMIYEPTEQLGLIILTNRAFIRKPDGQLDQLGIKIFRHLQTQLK